MLKIKRCTLIFIAAILTFFNISTGFSQVGLNFTYWTVLDGNAFRNYENLSDVVYQPHISLFYDRSGEMGGMRFYYEGSAFLFNDFSTRHYQYHNLGITANRLIGQSGTDLSWGLHAGKRFNTDEYQYYDYQQAQGYFHLRVDGRGKGLWMFGARFRVQDYEALSQFSFWETQAFVRASYFLKTRTTVIGQLQTGLKKFVEPIMNQTLVQGAAGGGKMGYGQGYGRSGNDPSWTRIVVVESPRDGIFQWNGSLRLAQSIGTKTGLALEGFIQRNPNGGGRILSGQDSGYETDDILFDDPYSYDSEKITLELTQLLPWNTQLRLGSEWTAKRYDRPAYDLEANPLDGLLRRDALQTGWISIRKTIPVKGFLKGLIFFLNFTYIDNESNDAYFNYTNRISGLGCHFAL